MRCISDFVKLRSPKRRAAGEPTFHARSEARTRGPFGRWIPGALLATALLAMPAVGSAQETQLPGGWEARLDRPGADMSQVRFHPMGTGYHLTLGPHAILYDPQNHAEGSYRATATFTQTRATDHPEAHGLFIGGRDLDGPGQDYLYFLVRQDGRFMIRHRAGDEVHTIQDWTEHPAVAGIDGEGSATNALAIEASPGAARFLVNGQEVASFADVPHLNTDGIVGIRASHNLDLHIDGFAIER